jgi:hypothetical protein
MTEAELEGLLRDELVLKPGERGMHWQFEAMCETTSIKTAFQATILHSSCQR